MKSAIIIFSMMLLFTACSSGGDSAPTTTSPWLGGTEGLRIEFLEGEPPTELLDNNEEPFSISIQVKNMGEDVVYEDEATFKVKGIPAVDLGVAPNDLIKGPGSDIEARRKNTDTGNPIESPPVFVSFEDLKYVPDLAGNLNREFFLEACYKYDTQATADLCIKENLRDTDDDKVCSIAGPKRFANSGAPVQITRFEEYGRGENSVGFTFEISHVGTQGLLYRLGTGCNDIPQNENRVEVRINVPSFEDGGLSCSGLTDKRTEEGWPVVGIKSIQGGPQEVNCEITLPEGEKFDGVTSVDIMLSYDYAQTIQKTVLIKSFE